MKSIRVTFEDGNTIDTEINGTNQEIEAYYLGNYFNFGDTEAHPKDKMLKGVSIKFY